MSLIGIGLAVLTMLRLKSFGAFLVIGAGLLSLMKSRNRLWFGGAALVLVAGLLFLRSLDPSPTKWERLEIWGSAFKVWERSPLVGVGPGVFAGLYHQVKSPRMSGVSHYLMDAQYTHNEFLELLTAFGLMGLGFGLLLLFKAWRKIQDPGWQSAAAGLGAASLFDFCLHTPLIALQGVGLLTTDENKKPKLSYMGGFLTLGLVMGLFVPPIFSGVLKSQAEIHLSQNLFLPSDLRYLEIAEQMNAWDARYVAAKADYLERLYLSTKDPVWAKRSDEAFERVIDLEKVEGQWCLKKAERLTTRLSVDYTPEAHQKVALAWTENYKLLPFNAFGWFEAGLFFMKEGKREEALYYFIRAAQIERYFPAAEVNAGIICREKGQEVNAREFFKDALEVYSQWKDADRIDPLEKQLVYLSPETVEFLKKELAK